MIVVSSLKSEFSNILAFRPLRIFAESSPTDNRGEIPFTVDQGMHFAVGIMIHRGLTGSTDITSVV